MNTLHKTLSALLIAALPTLVLAAGDHGAKPDKAAAKGGHDMAGMHKDAHASMAGSPGDPAKVNRTVKVTLGDNMRFDPSTLEVKAGETIRFFIVNQGKLAHEMVIGTADELSAHAKEMLAMPGMVHKDPNMIRLDPGKRGGIVWRFDKAGTFSYACLLPGHMEAGMVGSFEVK